MPTDTQSPVSPPSGSVQFFMERPVRGLEEGLGKTVHGLGPGPDGPERPIPLFLQLVDPEHLELSYRLGDSSYQVLANDQNRFSLPRVLPPILFLLSPGEDDNPTRGHVIARHAYSEGAFALLEAVLRGGYKFTLWEYVRLALGLTETQAFLHGEGIVQGQWNPLSIIAVPIEATPSPFDASRTHRYDVINTGLRFRDPAAIPREFIARGYYAPELFKSQGDRPDHEAMDTESDVHGLCAFLKDVFQWATISEELTRQAARIRDHYYRDALRQGREPDPEAYRAKEQEILDHLYTIKLRIETLVQSGLMPRGQRAHARDLHAGFLDLHERTRGYIERLGSEIFTRINVFGDELRNYVPYQISLSPARVNNFDRTEVAITGRDLPQDVVRVSLAEFEESMEVIEGSARSIRFRIPAGFPTGTHPILINNRRTNESLEITTPVWRSLDPEAARQPWPGFGPIVVSVLGENLPHRPDFAIESPGSAPSAAGALAAGPFTEAGGDRERKDPTRVPAVDVKEIPERGSEDGEDPAGDSTSLRGFRLEFPEETPAGEYRLLCNGLDTNLRWRVDDALPDPRLSPRGVRPAEVLNHRARRVTIQGRHFHPTMIVDLGEGAPDGLEVEIQPGSETTATLGLPAGYLPGDYTLRINRRPSECHLRVRQPSWNQIEPTSILLKQRDTEARELLVRGDNLPEIDHSVGDVYTLRTARGKTHEGAVLKTEVVSVGEDDERPDEQVHRLHVSPDLRRGRQRLFFGEWDTRLELRVHRRLPAWVGLAAALVALALVGFIVAEAISRNRPTIASVAPERVFNFGDSRVIVQGDRLEAVRLERVRTAESDESIVRTFPLEDWPDEEGASVFRPSGLPPGAYRVFPVSGWLSGSAAEEILEVVSPRFSLAPARVNRLETVTLTLHTENEFPMNHVLALMLADAPTEIRSEAPEATPGGETTPLPGGGRGGGAAGDGPSRKANATGGEAGIGRSAPTAGAAGSAGPPQEEGSPATASPEGTVAPGRPEPRLRFEIRAAGRVTIPRGTLTRRDEGRRQIWLSHVASDGEPGSRSIGGAFTADGAPLTVDVVGPRILAVEPEPVSLDEADEVRFRIEGENLPPKPRLALVERDADMKLISRLEGDPGSEIVGRALVGSWHLAWDLGAEQFEIARDEPLEILPAPRVTAVAPSPVPPDRPVELTLTGINLGEATVVALEPLDTSGGTGQLVMAVDSSRLREMDDLRSEYLTEALTLKSGKYGVRPGNDVVLEVIEDCQKLLDAYRVDSSGLEELMDCLAGGHAPEELQRETANLLFDQGRFVEALVLYRDLGDSQSRFRETLLRRTVVEETNAPFRAVSDDTTDDPYLRAARSLGWVGGEGGPPPAGAGLTWDLDYVRGVLAGQPQEAMEALGLSISKKRSAAVPEEYQPFDPALAALASARLDLAVALVGRAEPSAARQELERLREDPAVIERLTLDDQARLYFYSGHTSLWQTGDEEEAAAFFRQGAGIAGSSFGAYSGSYLASLRSAPPATAPAAAPGALLPGSPGGWLPAFLAAYRQYRQVRDGPNYNILTESYDFASTLYPEERKASRELHQTLRALENSTDIHDPVAHLATLFYVRNAQRLSWPNQEGGSRALAHLQRFEALALSPRDALIRDVYILEGQVGPLENAQLRSMPIEEMRAYTTKLQELMRASLPEGLEARLRRIQDKLKYF